MPLLVLMPGMDGTGELFADFTSALPDTITTQIVRYPRNTILSSSQLEELASSTFPSTPFFLLAESFSTPIAIRCAGRNSLNLKGIILCAGFVTPPVRGWKRSLALLARRLAFRLPLPKSVASRLLIGPNAPPMLLQSVRNVITSVKPTVLASRLEAALTCDVRTELGRYEGPILYLQARGDRLIAKRHAREIKQFRPQTVIEVISGPHLLLQREPQQAANAVARFIQQIVMKGQN